MEQICCPLYTVRCHATNFQLSKSQKKVIKRVNRYLIHGIGANPDKKESCCKEDFEDNNVDCEVDDSSVMAANECAVNESSSLSTVCRAKRKPPKPGILFHVLFFLWTVNSCPSKTVKKKKQKKLVNL